MTSGPTLGPRKLTPVGGVGSGVGVGVGISKGGGFLELSKAFGAGLVGH